MNRNLKDRGDQTPLSLAAQRSKVAAIRRLVDEMIETNCRDRKKRTPLIHAVVKDRPAALEVLLASDNVDRKMKRVRQGCPTLFDSDG